MKYSIIAIVATMLLATGCITVKLPDGSSENPIRDIEPVRLTRESIVRAEDGTRILVIYPRGSDEPVVVRDPVEDRWVVSAKVKSQ